MQYSYRNICLHNAEGTSTQCALTISTILEVDSFVHVLTPKMANGIGALSALRVVREVYKQQQGN